MDSNATTTLQAAPDSYADPEMPTLGEIAGMSEEEALASDARFYAQFCRDRDEYHRAIGDQRLERSRSIGTGTVTRTRGTRARRSRGKPIRTRGSRRSVASNDDDDGGGEPEPPPALVGLRKWWRRRSEELATFSRGEGA